MPEKGSGPRRCEITLNAWHEARLRERMEARTLTRSEAVRELIAEAHAAGTGRRERLRLLLREISLQARSIKLTAKGAFTAELSSIDTALAAAEQLLA